MYINLDSNNVSMSDLRKSATIIPVPLKYLEWIVLKYLLSDIDEPVSVFLEEKEIH